MSNKLYKDTVKGNTLLPFYVWIGVIAVVTISVLIYFIIDIDPYDMDMPFETQSALTPDVNEDNIAIGFLTLDGGGMASKPFMTESELTVEWGGNAPETWTALPILVYGEYNEEGNEILCNEWELYPYLEGTTGAADAYYACIENGWQKDFEELWTKVYDVLNTDSEHELLDASCLQNILQNVYGKDEFGDLRDIVTDCVVLISDINTNGPSEEYNELAHSYYDRFYSWLCNFSVDLLKTD